MTSPVKQISGLKRLEVIHTHDQDGTIYPNTLTMKVYNHQTGQVIDLFPVALQMLEDQSAKPPEDIHESLYDLLKMCMHHLSNNTIKKMTKGNLEVMINLFEQFKKLGKNYTGSFYEFVKNQEEDGDELDSSDDVKDRDDEITSFAVRRELKKDDLIMIGFNDKDDRVSIKSKRVRFRVYSASQAISPTKKKKQGPAKAKSSASKKTRSHILPSGHQPPVYCVRYFCKNGTSCQFKMNYVKGHVGNEYANKIIEGGTKDIIKKINFCQGCDNEAKESLTFGRQTSSGGFAVGGGATALGRSVSNPNGGGEESGSDDDSLN